MVYVQTTAAQDLLQLRNVCIGKVLKPTRLIYGKLWKLHDLHQFAVKIFHS